MNKNYKLIVAFLFITFVSFFRTSYVFAGGDVTGGDIKTEAVKVEPKKVNVTKELIF